MTATITGGARDRRGLRHTSGVHDPRDLALLGPAEVAAWRQVDEA